MSDTMNAGRHSESVNDLGNPTTDRLAVAAHGTIDRVAATAKQAEHGLRGAATKTAAAAKEAQDQLGVAADEKLAKLRSYIGQNPLVCAGIAFAAGVALTAVIRRQ